MEIQNVKFWVGNMEVEEAAVQQITNISQLPILAGHIAIMPDVHMGKGATVGSVIPTKSAIIPAAVGVDWEKTQPPQSSMESAFTDTFHDSDDVETLLGTIVLKDGTEYTVGVGNADKKFGEYVRVVMEYVKNAERVKDIFGE